MWPGKSRNELRVDLPIAAFEQHGGARVGSGTSDRRLRVGRLGQRDQRDTALGDGGFLGRNLGERLAKILLMVEADAGDAGDERAGDDVGRVEPAAKPDLEDAASARVREKASRAAAVATSKKLGSIPSPASSTSLRSAASISSSISLPAMRMRSLKRTRCGLVKA